MLEVDDAFYLNKRDLKFSFCFFTLDFFFNMALPNEVIVAIQRVLPDAQVTVEDLKGSGDHLQVNVISSKFVGLPLVRQHQLVYSALKNELASEAIHALALNTSIPT